MNPHALQHALETAFTWTWQTSLQATVVIAVVLLVQLAFRKVLTPRWCYALGLLMLLRLALPFAPASPMSIFNLGSRFATRPPVQLEIPPAPAMPLPSVTIASMPVAPATPPAIAPRLTPVVSPRPETVINFRLIAAGVWLAGCAGMLVLVARQHRRFVLMLGRWEPVTEPRVLGLLGECRARLGVKREITILAATGPGTPALFGIMRPRLLIPADMLRQLDDRELRHIFLHELIHLRHGDVLLNWVMILCRSLHWFNPAVWLAMKKLRADQELACDAAVMARLAPDERRQYGGTLLKLLGDFSAVRLSPGFVPFITNKHTIKRRIIMISKFKPAGRLVAAGSLALLLALGCFTFTRAAERAKTNTQPPDSPLTVVIGQDGALYVGDRASNLNPEQLKQTLQAGIGKNPRFALIIKADKNTPLERLVKVLEAAREVKIEAVSLWTGDGAGPEEMKNGTQKTLPSDSARNVELARSIEIFDREVTNYEMKIKEQERVVDGLRQKLGVVDTDAQATSPAPTLSAATLLTLQNTIIEAEIQAAGLKTMMPHLKDLPPEQLRQTLPTVIPDQILTALLQDRNSEESLMVKQKMNLGDNHPDVAATRRLIETTDLQIDGRTKAILGGIQVQIDSINSKIEELKMKIKTAKDKDLEMTAKTMPYWIEKAKLEQLKRFVEVLFFRAGQEKMNMKMPTNESVK